MRTIGRPGAAMTVALVALFVALGGTAVAATPIVKRALLANNALKLQGRTAAQVAALPGPTSSVGGLVSVASAEYRIGVGGTLLIDVPCGAGQRAIAGGVSTALGGRVSASTSYPSAAGTWTFDLVNLRTDGPAVGNAYAICIA
jgi:hypothetical protein